jgi:hypothetical protein
MMEEAAASAILIPIYRAMHCHIREEQSLNICHCDNSKYYTIFDTGEFCSKGCHEYVG